MAYEQRDNSGSLFKNDKKGNEKAPDYRGNSMINGKLMKISAWLKEGKNGTKFMSLSFQPDDGPKGAPQPPKPPKIPVTGTAPEDDVPF